MESNSSPHFGVASSNYPTLDALDPPPYPQHDSRDFQLAEHDQYQDLSQNHIQQEQPDYHGQGNGLTDGTDFVPHMTNEDDAVALDMPPSDEKTESDGVNSPGQPEPVRPSMREVTKNADGKYYCANALCAEEIKTFNRRCEWR